MRNMAKVLMLVCVMVLSFGSCASGPAPKAKGPTYTMELDNSIMDDSRTLASWMSYCGTIERDMEKYDAANPDGTYIKSYAIELEARQGLIKAYTEIGENMNLKDKRVDVYIGEMMRISEAGYMKEYVYFSFNPGSWELSGNLREAEYREWMQTNLPGHKPLTLGRVERSSK
jgi:hypothetical protein